MAVTFKKIQTLTVTTATTANVQFTNIPQTYTDLAVFISARSDGLAASGGAVLFINPNASTSSLSIRRLQGNGSTVSSSTDTRIYARINPSDYTASTFGNSFVYIPNYAGSTNKSFSVDAVNENNATAAIQMLVAGLWSDTTAITSLELIAESGNLVQHSTATLYGISKS